MNRTTRPGKTVAAGVTLAAAVGVAVIATILMRGGGTGSGSGEGTGPASGTGSGTGSAIPAASLQSTQPSGPFDTAATAQRPLKVTVRESTYLVNGREVALAQILELAAKVPDGSGPPVLIEHEPTSRAKAEEELEAALNQGNIQFAAD